MTATAIERIATIAKQTFRFTVPASLAPQTRLNRLRPAILKLPRPIPLVCHLARRSASAVRESFWGDLQAGSLIDAEWPRSREAGRNKHQQARNERLAPGD